MGQNGNVDMHGGVAESPLKMTFFQQMSFIKSSQMYCIQKDGSCIKSSKNNTLLAASCGELPEL